MDSISLVKRNQKSLNKTVKKIKGKINTGNIEIKEKLPEGKKKKSSERGVVYIGHIPHGFYEEQIASYFSQFGIVTRIRVARSSRTGRSKGYAFVEFLHPEIAKVAADTMNNYLMYNRLLKCQYIPPEQQHPRMFVCNAMPDDYPKQKKQIVSTKKKNKRVKPEKEEELRKKTEKKIEDFKRFFEERGIEFNFKVNYGSDEAPLTGNEITNGEAKHGDDFDSDSEDETDERYGVLEIDESDDEIEFKTPPQVKKIIKRSSSTSALITPALKKPKTGLKEKGLHSNGPIVEKEKKKNKSTVTVATGSKFPKIQGNLKKWVKSLNQKNGVTNQKKGIGGGKYQKKTQVKGKRKVS